MDPWLTGITAYADVKCESFVLPPTSPRCQTISVAGVWITVGCSTATGWEHCIANMFYVQLWELCSFGSSIIWTHQKKNNIDEKDNMANNLIFSQIASL